LILVLYPLTECSPDLSSTSYTVLIALDDLPPSEVTNIPESQFPTILLTVSYPETYPDVPPSLSISHPQDLPKPSHLSLLEDGPHLLSTLTSTIEESLGAAMIFTLISTLKESAETLVRERMDEAQNVIDKEKIAEEEKENAKFHGKQVTRESFLSWREGFFREMEEVEVGKKREQEAAKGTKPKANKEELKLTGRELWERGLVGRGDDEEMDQEVEVGVEGLKMGD